MRVGSAQAARGVYLALGDSLATGDGATDPGRDGYVPRIFQSFPEVGIFDIDTLTNVGVGGETSTSLIFNGQLARALVAINDPTTDIWIVTLDIGGNDLLPLLQPGSPCLEHPDGAPCHTAIAATLTSFSENYAQILGQISSTLATDPGPEVIIVMTYYNHLSGTGDPYEELDNVALLGADRTIDCSTPRITLTIAGGLDARRGQPGETACRWGIEVWHTMVKSGCRQALYGVIHQTPVPPTTPPTRRQAVRWIAQLGGFLARASDGEPGPIVLWRGFQHLADHTIMYRLMKPHQPTQKCG